MHQASIRPWLLSLALFVPLLFAAPAHAFGQVFPPPISTTALERWLGRYVKPPAETRAAIEAAHDRYLDEFRRLQDAELESFAKQRPPMLSGGDMPAWMRRYSALRGRINSLDSALFEAIRQAVPEPHRSGVDRMRWLRETEVLQTGLLSEMGMGAGGGGSGRLSLSDIVYSIGLSDEDLARADVLLREYEQRMLAAVRKGAEEAERLLTKFADTMRERGLWGDDLERLEADPERAMEAWRQMADVIRETFGGMAVIAQSNREVARRGYIELRDRLSWDGQIKLAPAWLKSSAPMLSWHFPQEFIDFAQRAREAVGPDSETGRSIETIAHETMRRVFAALDATERMEDRFMAEMMGEQFSMMEDGAMDAHRQLMESQQQKRKADHESRHRIIASGGDAIRALLSPEVVERLKLPKGANMEIEWNGPLPVAGDGRKPAEEAPEETEAPIAGDDGRGHELHVDALASQLTPYGVAHLQRFITEQRLGEDTRSLLEVLHSDYLSQWAEEMGPKRAAYDQARLRIYEPEGDGAARLNSSRAEHAAAILRDLVSTMERLDGQFFSAMAAALDASQAMAVRVERLGRITQSLGLVMYRDLMYRPNAEQPVDVVAVLKETPLPEGDRAELMAIIAEHADSITETSRQAFLRALEAQLANEKYIATMMNQQLSAEDRVKIASEWQQGMDAISAPVKAATEARRKAVSAVLDAAQEKLPEASIAALHRAWTRASHPSIFKDPSAHFATIEKIERLPDLTPEQAEQVAAVLKEYRTAYDLACDAMLAAALAPVPQLKPSSGSEYWMAMQERERAISRMRFERDEASARAASRLRQILTPEQLAQFRTLKDPAKTAQQQPRPW